MKRKNIIFLVCYFAYISIYIARTNLSVAAPELKNLAILTTEQIGFLGSLFSVIYACGRLLSGWVADRIKPVILVCTGLCLCSIGNIFCGFLPGFAAIVVLWSINALAQSMLWGPILRILSEIFPEDIAKRRASYMGSAVAVGNIAGILLTGTVINHWGVSWAFFMPGIITALLSGTVLVFTLRIEPRVPEAVSGNSTNKFGHGLWIMLVPALIHGIMKDNISLWMATFAVERFGLNLETTTYYILLIPALGFLGRMLAPSLLKPCKGSEHLLIILSLLGCFLGTALLTLLPLPGWAAIALLSFVYMAVSVINACLLAFFPIHYAKTNQVASVSGILDFATYLGTGLSAMVYGTMIVHFGYESMFLSWCVFSALGAGILYYYQLKHRRPSK